MQAPKNIAVVEEAGLVFRLPASLDKPCYRKCPAIASIICRPE
jgi:hypothetical protein